MNPQKLRISSDNYKESDGQSEYNNEIEKLYEKNLKELNELDEENDDYAED